MAQDFEDHSWKDVIPAEDLATYTTFRRETRVGVRPALLMIDFYNSVYRGGAKPPHELAEEFPMTCGVYAWNALEPTKKLLAAARAAGIPVIYTTSARGTSGLKATARDARAAQKRADDYAIFPEVAPTDDEIVIVKERASGFFGTTMAAHLVRLDCNSIIVAGESTSGCVRATVVDGFSHGYHTVVVEDCVYDRALLTHKVNLFDMHHKYADVMSSDDVIAHLAKLGRKAAAE
jgi:nicotinamidase-related amidase